MTSVLESINEQRIAFEELHLIHNQIKTKYGGTLPIEVLKPLAELAQLYRRKYGSGDDKKRKPDLENFCAKNNLPSEHGSSGRGKVRILLNYFSKYFFF